MPKKNAYLIVSTCFLLLLLNNFEITCQQTSNMPEPYNSIVILPFNAHGYFNPANEKKLREIITSKPIKTVIEVGTWLGASARFMASLLPADGKLYAVDHFLGSAEILLESHPDRNKVATMYQQFLSNVIHTNLTHKIIPVRMSSLEAAQALNVHADLIYIDASHDEESVYNDILAWYPKLNLHGVMCGDDYGGGGDQLPIKRAVHRAATALGVNVKVAGGWFWYFE